MPTMALAIIVDDRTDVWEDNVKSQIVQARPFNHYPALAAQLVGAFFLPKQNLSACGKCCKQSLISLDNCVVLAIRILVLCQARPFNHYPALAA